MDFDLALSRQASKALLLKRSLRSFTRFPAARSYLTASMIDVYNIWLYGVYRVLRFLLVCIKKTFGINNIIALYFYISRYFSVAAATKLVRDLASISSSLVSVHLSDGEGRNYE